MVLANERALSEADVLVVNSGAHKREEHWYRLEMMAASKSLASSMRRLHGNDTVLIARNTVPGHSGCNERWGAYRLTINSLSSYNELRRED